MQTDASMPYKIVLLLEKCATENYMERDIGVKSIEVTSPSNSTGLVRFEHDGIPLIAHSA